MQDVTQIELVILGKEKELTFLDLFGEAETINKPIERLINLGIKGPVAVRAIGAKDLLVAVGTHIPQRMKSSSRSLASCQVSRMTMR